MKKKSEMTEDEEKQSGTQIQELTDKIIKNIDVIVDKKKADIMSI